MLYIRSRKKIAHCHKLLAITLFSFFIVKNSYSQFFTNDENAQFTMGLSLGVNNNKFATDMHSRFLDDDSLYMAEAKWSRGFNLGLLLNYKVTEHYHIRFNPQLMFFERPIFYKLKNPSYYTGTTEETKKIESTVVSFPIQAKLVSDKIGNFRFYALGGLKADVDLASNADSRKAEDLVKISKYDYGYEVGAGVSIHFPYFILSPEIKFSNGFNNIHTRDKNLIYSSAFDKIQSRMIVFSIHIGG